MGNNRESVISPQQDPQPGEQFGLYVPQRTEYEGVVARKVIGGLINIMATEIVDEDKTRENLDQMAALRREGYGVLVPYPHFSRRETVEVPNFLITAHDDLLNAPLLTPLAAHQDNPVLRITGRLTNLDMKIIVTEETVNKGKNIIKPPLVTRAKDTVLGKLHPDHEPQQPKILKQGTGMREYSEAAAQILARQGIVFIAPQGGRKITLGKPEHSTIEGIVRVAAFRKVENIAIMPVAVSIKDVPAYTKDTMGYNWRATYQLQAGVPRTIDEFREHAKAHGNTIDQQVFADLGDMMPDIYVNP